MNFLRLCLCFFCIAGMLALGAGDAVRIGLDRMRAGDFDGAADSFAQAADDAPSLAARAQALYNRAVALDALGRTQEAIENYSIALRLDARLAPALNNRANAYRRLGRVGEARRDYRAALAIAGARREYAYYGLGRIAESARDYGSARGFYRRALKAEPNFILARQALAALDSRRPASKMPARQASPPALRPAMPERSEAELRAKERDLRAKIEKAKAEIARLKKAKAAETGAVRFLVQIASMRSEKDAEAAWRKLSAQNAAALQGLRPRIVAADLPGRGRFYRLRIPVADMKAARRLCIALALKGQDCLIVRA